MSRTTSYTLSPELDSFVQEQVDSGAFRSASEVVRAALRAMADEQQKMAALRAAIDEGLASPLAEPGTWARVRAAAQAKR